MNNAFNSEHYIILASTLFGAALGYVLSRPRQTHRPDRYHSLPAQAHPRAKAPVLIAPLSSTIH